MSNGASIVLEQAAARPDASVFLRPSVRAEDEDDAAVGCLSVDAATVVAFALAHPPPLGTVCKQCKFDDDLAHEICTDRRNKYSANITITLREEAG